jgi:hypothetical protein
MPASSDDNVVVHGNAERGCDIDDRFRHLDVGLRRRRIAARVMVHQAAASSYCVETKEYIGVIDSYGGGDWERFFNASE